MNSIEILENEHANIKKVIRVIRKISLNIVEGMEVPYDDLYLIIDFIKNYADKYHHGKEEDMLFMDMSNELSDKIGSGPIQGMLIEHNSGRNFVRNLEIALASHKNGDKESLIDVIANAVGYGNLLSEHINKEDNMLYRFAINNLKEDTLNKLDAQFDEFEETKEHIEIKKKYLDLIDNLERKYL